MRGEIERTVRSFEDRTYGGSGHTRTHWHVTTDGAFERQVGVHHSNAHGEHGALLTPNAARRLARALNTAADRADKEQTRMVRGAVRRSLKNLLAAAAGHGELEAALGPKRRRR